MEERVVLFAAALLAALPGPSILLTPPVNARRVERRIEIRGMDYRVVTTGGYVSIAGGDPVTPLNAAALELRKAAVHRVTGCKMYSEYWSGRTLSGLLDCSNRTIP